MTIYYVSSAATGTGDGSSYTNAVTTFAAGVAKLAAGDSLFVLASHTESTGAATTYAFPGTNASPNFVVVTDSPGNPTAATGSITTAGLTIAGSAAMNPMPTFISSLASTSSILLNSSTGSWQRYANGATGGGFQLSATGTAAIAIGTNGGVGRTEWANVPVKFAGANNSIRVNNTFSWRNTSSAVSGTVPATLFSAPATCFVRLEALDLSFVTTAIVAAISSNVAVFDIKDCKVAPTAVLAATPTTIGSQVQTSRTDSAGTNYKTNLITYRGAQSTETALVRTGGASDGTTAISWKLATNAGVSWASHFEAPPIVIWNATTGTNRQVTLRGLWFGSAIPLVDQFWFDVEYLGDASSGQGFYSIGTKANMLATGTALAADTGSAWDSLVPARANLTAYTVGQMVKVASNPGRVFFCTVAGTTGAVEPSGFGSAVDGGTVSDGTTSPASFRAAYRFSLTVTLSSPQPQQAGYIYVYPKVGAASSTFYLDPLITLG